jgi:hypothetical protein
VFAPQTFLSGSVIANSSDSLLQLGNTTLSGGNANGTYLGLNAPSSGAGSAADLLNLQHAGTEYLLLKSDGTLEIDGGGSFGYTFDGAGATFGSDAFFNGYATFNQEADFFGAAVVQTTGNGVFEVKNVGGSSFLKVTTNNYAGGANAANTVLSIAKDSGTGRSINAAGTINASGADFAEYYYQQHPGALKAGEIVCLTDNQTVDSCTNGSVITGVVSANAGYVGNDIFDAAHPDKTAIVGMLGQLPVKVNMEGGAIKPGDPVGISSEPGVGMKVSNPGTPIVGYAMAAATQDGTVKVLVRPGYYAPSGTRLVQGGQKYVNPLTVNGALVSSSINTGGLAELDGLNVTGTATIGGNLSVDGDLTVHGVTRLAELLVSGHILSQAGKPQVVAGTAAGQDGTVTIDGTDTAGTITVMVKAHQLTIDEAQQGMAAETLGSGDLADVTFAKSYQLSPRVVITPDNAASTELPVYIEKTQGGYKLVTTSAAQEGRTYQFDYVVLGSGAN